MSDLPLGASTWCFSGLLPPELRTVADGGAAYSRERTLALRAYFTELSSTLLRSRISSVELWYSPILQEQQVVEQLERLARAGRISSMHAPFGAQMDLSSLSEDVRQAGVKACCSAAELLSRLGGRILVVHGSSQVADSGEMPERASRSAASIADIADCCRDLRISVAVEVLSGPAVGTGASELLALLEQVGRPNVGVCVDVNHVFPPHLLLPTIQTLGERILTLHICDYDGIAEKHWLPMQGTIDWPGLIRVLRQVRYAGPFTYEARFESAGITQAVSMIEQNYRAVMEAAG